MSRLDFGQKRVLLETGAADDLATYFARKTKALSLFKQKRKPKHLSLIQQRDLSIPKIT